MVPFIFDESDLDLPDDDWETFAPKATDFEYLGADDYRTTPGPIRFTLPDAAGDSATATVDEPRPGLFGRLFGRAPSTGESEELRALVPVLVPAMRALGVKSVYCRYDGGNDEGFAWIDSAALENGQTVDGATLRSKLEATGVQNQLSDPDSDYVLQYGLADAWAALLLGQGYGTGEYSMYGAFTADLVTGELTDDALASPVVENITLADPE